MTHEGFLGHHYPAGAASDPRAPYNTEDPPELECRGCGTEYGEGHWFHGNAYEEELDDHGRVCVIQPSSCPACDPVSWEACGACGEVLVWAGDPPGGIVDGPGFLHCHSCGCTEAYYA